MIRLHKHSPSRNQKLALMILILLLGALMRIYHLNLQSIWGDEAFTYVMIRTDDFWATLARDVHPPLYFLLITTWTKFAGISEFSMRLPSALAGMVGLALLYALAKEIQHHRPQPVNHFVPLFAVLLMALADLDIQIAQEARSYTLHIVWIVLSLLAYLKWLRTAHRGWAVTFIISTSLIVYTHYIGVFTPIAIGVHALFFLRGKQRMLAIGMLVLAALLFFPWIAVVLGGQVEKFAGDAVPAFPSSWGTLWTLRTSWFTQQWALMLGLALAGIVTTVNNSIKLRPFIATGLLLICIIVPTGLAFLSNRWLPTLYDYRISQITPAIMLLIAFGLANFRRDAQFFFVVVIVLYSLVSVDVYRPKPPWREFGQLTAEYAQGGSLVLLEFTGGDYTIDYYLDRYLPENIAVVSMWQWRTWEPDTYESGILGTIYNYDTVWLARWSDDNEAFVKLEKTGHVPTMRRSIEHAGNQLELYRFDRLPENPVTTFENGMVLQAIAQSAGQVDLWWTSKQPLADDYVISVKVLDDSDNIIDQLDQQAQLNTRPTTSWQPHETIYDPYRFTVDQTDHPLLIQVYHWVGGEIELILDENGLDGVMIEKENLKR